MIKKIIAVLLAAAMTANLCGCGQAPTAQESAYFASEYGMPAKLENDTAECFTIYEYENGGSLIETSSGDRLLVLPEGAEKPASARDTAVIRVSPENIYMAASAVMCFFDALDRVSEIRFSALEAGDWYIDSAADAM